MNFFQRIVAALRSINTHSAAHFGATLVAAGGAAQIPQVQAGVALIHDGGKTQATVNVASVALIAIGSALCYFGRPDTIPHDPPGAGNHSPGA
jgi:hypothetical protein